MKAISLHQPWASSITLGLKKYETRSLPTKYRGSLLICSAKFKSHNTKSVYAHLKDKYFKSSLISFESLPYGSAIAVVDITDCIKINESFIQSQPETEIDCGGWAIGRYAWKLENIRRVIPVIGVKGKQGFFNLEVELTENDLEAIHSENIDIQHKMQSLPHRIFSQGETRSANDAASFARNLRDRIFCPADFAKSTLSRRKIEKPVIPSNAPIAVVLFAGGGGIEAGMVEAGIRPVVAVEFNPEKSKLSGALADCHSLNFSEYGCSVIRETVQQLSSAGFPGFPNTPDYLHASPMCSHFSNALAGDAIETEDDIRAAMAVTNAIAVMQPKNFTLENVARYQASQSFQIIKSTLELEGYQVVWDVVNMADYGLPQSRRRLILRASKTRPIPLPQKSAHIGWYEAIAHLIPLMADSQLVPGQEKTLTTFLQKNDSTPLLIDRVGARKEYRYKPGHLPCNTILRSHFTDGKGANRNKFADIWLPDNTIKSLSIEAAAILQGFPDWYQFPNDTATAGSIIGYSVPPSFAKQIFAIPKIPNLYDFLYHQLMARGLSEVDAISIINKLQ